MGRAIHTHCGVSVGGKLLKAFYEIVMVMSGNSKKYAYSFTQLTHFGEINPLGIKTLMHKDRSTKSLFQLYLGCQKTEMKLKVHLERKGIAE